ncbi:MAG: ribbon-helix-helix domain-containing protein [Alphaproteobacteria bacterium]|nr:ribbon-helix-helix domain-containing protein [Alphaproteobacteria bacterium]
MVKMSNPVPALRTKNVRIGEKRTSVRLEPAFWSALDRAAEMEGITIHALCTQINSWNEALGLTAAMRVFLLVYVWSGSLETALNAARSGDILQRPQIRR